MLLFKILPGFYFARSFISIKFKEDFDFGLPKIFVVFLIPSDCSLSSIDQNSAMVDSETPTSQQTKENELSPAAPSCNLKPSSLPLPGLESGLECGLELGLSRAVYCSLAYSAAVSSINLVTARICKSAILR